MSLQIPLVYEPEARARDMAKSRAESANWRNVQLAREAAERAYAKLGRPISSDDIRNEAPELFEYTAGPKKRNWMGAVWNEDWAPVEGFVRSRTPNSHSNLLRRWVLKSEVKR